LIIQLNTDKNIDGGERLESYLSEQINEELSHYSNHITRIEVHLADENSQKKGVNDKRCTLEARLEKRQPIAVTSHAETVERAVTDALNKLNHSLGSIIGKLRDR
jgi:ribosome-associated translation inhibitor RaiA